MKTWEVFLEGVSSEQADDFSLRFVDLKELIGGYLGISGQILGHLKSLVSTQVHYNAAAQLKKVVESTTGDEFSGTFFALMGVAKEEKLDFGFLFLLTAEGLGVIAMYPELVVHAFHDNEDAIKTILSLMFQKPDHWETMTLFLPVQSSDP